MSSGILLAVGLMLRSSETPRDTDLGNLLVAGSLINLFRASTGKE